MHNIRVRIYGLIIFFILGISAEVLSVEIASEKVLSDEEYFSSVDTFYDPDKDYSIFPGRVSDRDNSGNVIKVKTENSNIKFLKPGDLVHFKVTSLKDKDECDSYVRDIEDGFFVVYVKDFYPCWGKEDYFRRGTQLNFRSNTLAKRVKEASVYRVLLLKRKRDFLRQLNKVNHFIWSYSQERVKVAAKYDKKIADIERAKQKEIESLLTRKNEKINTQKELIYRLDKIDKDLSFYIVEKVELLQDRWTMDHDLGLPFGKRPQEVKD